MAKDFTHFDSHGNAIMVDVSAKEISIRSAEARGSISMSSKAMKAVLDGSVKKGDVFSVARIAGIMAAKKCSELIPLCHPISIDECIIDFNFDSDINDKINEIEAVCRVKLSARTGAEMEALTGVSIALLTIYDMCKVMDKNMLIGNIRLHKKSGGSSGHFQREN